MREYLYELKHNDALVTSIIPLGDGAAVSVKRSESVMREPETRKQKDRRQKMGRLLNY